MWSKSSWNGEMARRPINEVGVRYKTNWQPGNPYMDVNKRAIEVTQSQMGSFLIHRRKKWGAAFFLQSSPVMSKVPLLASLASTKTTSFWIIIYVMTSRASKRNATPWCQQCLRSAAATVAFLLLRTFPGPSVKMWRNKIWLPCKHFPLCQFCFWGAAWTQDIR